jgi:phosphate transport system ATP-binding protein
VTTQIIDRPEQPVTISTPQPTVFEPAPPSKLVARRLEFFYGDHQVIHTLNMEIPAGRVTAIIGPSGCGKSTFLRTLNRIHELYPDQRVEGRVMLDGRDIFSRDVHVLELRRRIGMIFQKPSPLPMSIFENVAFGLRLHYKCSRTELHDRVEDSLKKAALWDEVNAKLKKPATALSGGQQQRLCIARAIAVTPEVLLMDEPCSALDPASTARIEELILQLREAYTIVIVTHNMQQARRVSDHTAFMLNGRLIEFAETKAVFEKPQDPRTADYVRGHFG